MKGTDKSYYVVKIFYFARFRSLTFTSNGESGYLKVAFMLASVSIAAAAANDRGTAASFAKKNASSRNIQDGALCCILALTRFISVTNWS